MIRILMSPELAERARKPRVREVNRPMPPPPPAEPALEEADDV